jgi:uncharacterized protein YbjT (DUF2867 family)
MVVTVTGSTGTIGGELTRLLSAAGVPARAVFRTAPPAPLPGVVAVRADLRDERLLEPALAGTDRLFLLTGNAKGFAELQIQVLHAAERLGVAHVVKLSALGASGHSNSWIAREHWRVEQELQRSSMTWTLLRPHAFMQNWLGEEAASVRSRATIESAIGDARVPFLDTRDIAEVAREALLHPEAHAGRKLFLTGGEAVGYADVAAAIGQAIGSRVAFEPITMEQARERLRARGTPPEQAEALLAILAYQRAGGPTSVVSDNVARLLGRPPRTIFDFARDHADHFRGSEGSQR